MTKQQEFLLIVQTTILANAVHLAADPDAKEKYRADRSGTGVFNAIADAIEASRTIPDEMAARDAANDFVTYALTNQRDYEEAAAGEPMSVPYWFAKS